MRRNVFSLIIKTTSTTLLCATHTVANAVTSLPYTGNTVNDNLLYSEKQETFEASHVEVLLAPPSSFPFSVSSTEQNILPPANVVKARLEATFLRPQVADLVQLRLRNADTSTLLKQLGNERVSSVLANGKTSQTFSDSFVKFLAPRVKDLRVDLNADDLKWIDPNKLAGLLSIQTTNAKISVGEWNSALRSQRAALEEHFGMRFREVASRIYKWKKEKPGNDIPLDVFLPNHLQDLMRTFHPYRGRNCFATALSFADKFVVNRTTLNSVRENDHDRYMINSDEFSQALWLGYTELKPEEIMMGLHYGDIVVFIEGTEPLTHYKSMRHAAVHVADNLFFHKASKSAATPIEFTTWNKLVANWSSLTKRLDYRVFRKIPMGAPRYLKPNVALEKLQWLGDVKR